MKLLIIIMRANLLMQISRRGMSNKNSSEFKSFFRLRLQDRPIKLATKLRETYKTSKTVRKAINIAKYIFGKLKL